MSEYGARVSRREPREPTTRLSRARLRQGFGAVSPERFARVGSVLGSPRGEAPWLMTDTDVLIVGAGPTGLVLALWLTRLGVRVRIVDKTAEPGTTSRALAVQARTLELYRQVGLADAVVAAAGR